LPNATFVKAINNGHFTTRSGLTAELINNHLPLSNATVKCHIKQEFKKLQSTKNLTEHNETEQSKENELDIWGECIHECYVTIATKEDDTTYSDLGGHYPVKLAQGNQYILICYDYDSNAILTAAIKQRSAGDINNTLQKILATLTDSGHGPKLHILDNEASDQLKHCLLKNMIQYQLVPPHIHCRNAAERAIQTFKAHFIAGLCSIDDLY
jgi:hypothetical protein